MTNKIDKWFHHEGLDRAHMIMVMMEEAFGYSTGDPSDELHPAIYNAKCRTHLEAAQDAMMELYQEIGQWEDVE